MLTHLRIKNLALVADLSLELKPGYNAITGETGAGKSILIGALNLVLGGRADRNLIRSGADNCSVEASFDIQHVNPALHSFLDANGIEPCDQNQLVLKRSCTITGANRQFVNGSVTSLQSLATISDWLVDIHGPHDHQSLLYPAKQLAILDAFGALEPQRHLFAKLLRHRLSLEAEKASLITDDQSYAQQLDLLRFQAHEIEAAKLQPDEESLLNLEHARASNAAKILQATHQAIAILSDQDPSLSSQLGALGRTISDLSRLDPATLPFVSLHEQASDLLHDLQSQLSRYADRIDLDPARLLEIEERLNLVHSLKRKYGNSIDQVIAFGHQARQQLQALQQRDADIERLNLELKSNASELIAAGRQLSASRQKLIPKLCKAVTRQLADLGFKQSQLQIALQSHLGSTLPDSISPAGFDSAEFLFSPNPGEPPKPLRAIASSGELARVMLALKTVLAAQDDVLVLVFDEVDANVGGETAHAIGEKMRQIALQRQVLCITHLAPVAAAAHAHFLADKQFRDHRTTTDIRLLSLEHRVDELTRMLGGQTPAARHHAQALLDSQK